MLSSGLSYVTFVPALVFLLTPPYDQNLLLSDFTPGNPFFDAQASQPAWGSIRSESFQS